jgi:3-deoxy-manno-octulosonate cytidylyltransferase (CMP-KDO synthetase)
VPHWRDATAAAVCGYKHIGLYAYRHDFLLRFAQLAPTPLEQAEKLEQLRALEWGFRVKVAEITRDCGVEVDTPADLERARAMAAERLAS